MASRDGKWKLYYTKVVEYCSRNPKVPMNVVFDAVAAACGDGVTSSAVRRGYYGLHSTSRMVSVHKNSKLSTCETSILLTALLRLDATNRPSDRRGVAQLVKEVPL